MFTLPPLPPKDYVLKRVGQNQASTYEHTPLALPRVTQANVALFCSPIEYQPNDKLSKIPVPEINPQILEKDADEARAFWVNKPGENDFLLHDVYHKYSVVVEPSYDARFKHKENVFYRSFKYEFECMEEARLEKLRRKMAREEGEVRSKEEMQERKRVLEEKSKTMDVLKIRPCKQKAPFWWRVPCDLKKGGVASGGLEKGAELSTYQEEYLHWCQEPNYIVKEDDPCQRRADLGRVGQLYQSEACNWYYKNYPPPSFKPIFKRFV